MKHAEKDVGKIHPFYLGRLNSKATRLMRINRKEEAKVIVDETIEIAGKLYSKEHPKYAGFLSVKANYLHDSGYFDETHKLYADILKIQIKNYGKNNYEYARIINNLAYVFEDKGDLLKAQELYAQSAKIRRTLDPDNLIRIASTEANLARVFAKLKMNKESSDLLASVIPVFELNSRNNLYNKITEMANVFADGSDADKCKLGHQMLENLTPNIEQESVKSWKRLGASLWIGQLLSSCGYHVKAKPWFISSLEISKNIYQKDSQGYKMVKVLSKPIGE